MDELLDVLDVLVFRGRLTVGREANGVDGVEVVRDDVAVVGVWVAEVDGLVEEDDEEVVDIVVVGFDETREGRSIEQ